MTCGPTATSLWFVVLTMTNQAASEADRFTAVSAPFTAVLPYF